MADSSSNSGCSSNLGKIVIGLIVLALLGKAVEFFEKSTSLKASEITSSTPRYEVSGLYDWWEQYGLGDAGLEEMKKAMKGKIVILHGEVDHVERGEEPFVNFKELHISGLNHASATAKFRNADALKEIKKGGVYSIAGRFSGGDYYHTKSIVSYGGEKGWLLYVTLDDCIIINN